MPSGPILDGAFDTHTPPPPPPPLPWPGLILEVVCCGRHPLHMEEERPKGTGAWHRPPARSPSPLQDLFGATVSPSGRKLRMKAERERKGSRRSRGQEKRDVYPLRCFRGLRPSLPSTAVLCSLNDCYLHNLFSLCQPPPTHPKNLTKPQAFLCSPQGCCKIHHHLPGHGEELLAVQSREGQGSHW